MCFLRKRSQKLRQASSGVERKKKGQRQREKFVQKMVGSQNTTLEKQYHMGRMEMGKKVGLIWIGGLRVWGGRFYVSKIQ